MFLKLIGLIFMGLAILGAALPVLPTTPFLLVAATFFAKSSPRLHAKLLANPVFGQLIINWQNHRGISLKGKIVALITMLITVVYSCSMLENNTYRILVIVLMLFPAIFITRLPIVRMSD